MNLVKNLNKEGFDVKYEVKMSTKYGSLEVFLELQNKEKERVFSKMNTGFKLDDDSIPDVIEVIRNKI